MKKQEKINYSDIMDLKFNEEYQSDQMYYDEYGFEYSIITKYLTKKIYLDWEKDTRFCKLIRMDNPKKMNIKAELPIMDLTHLKEIINFFTDKKESYTLTDFA